MEKLPDYWCVEQSMSQEACDWFSKQTGTKSANIGGLYKYMCFDENTKEASFKFEIPTGCVLLTNDQFKRLVLKEEWEPKKGDLLYINDKDNYSTSEHYIGKFINISGPHFAVEFITPNIIRENWMNCKIFYVDKEYCRPALPHEIPAEEVEYVECAYGGYHTLTMGKIYPVIRRSSGFYRIKDDKNNEDGYTIGIHIKPSTREAYEAQERKGKQLSKEELLEEAKRRYPVGTRFKSVHTKKEYTVKSNNYYIVTFGITVDVGPHINEYLYLDNGVPGEGKGWSEIVESVNKCQTINQNKNEHKSERKEVVLRGKTYTIPSGQRKTGIKVHAKRLLSPSTSRS